MYMDAINYRYNIISQILENAGIQYFNITALEKINNYKADILFEISKPTSPHRSSSCVEFTINF